MRLGVIAGFALQAGRFCPIGNLANRVESILDGLVHRPIREGLSGAPAQGRNGGL